MVKWDVRCPYCRTIYSWRGIKGHIRSKHAKEYELDKYNKLCSDDRAKKVYESLKVYHDKQERPVKIETQKEPKLEIVQEEEEDINMAKNIETKKEEEKFDYMHTCGAQWNGFKSRCPKCGEKLDWESLDE